jgi:hypothetical protein
VPGEVAQITSNWDYFVDLVKAELPYISSAVGGAGLHRLRKFSSMKLILDAPSEMNRLIELQMQGLIG